MIYRLKNKFNDTRDMDCPKTSSNCIGMCTDRNTNTQLRLYELNIKGPVTSLAFVTRTEIAR